MKNIKIYFTSKKIIRLLFVISIMSISCNNVTRVNQKHNNEKIVIEETDLKESDNYKGIKSCQEGYDLAKKEIKIGKIKYIFGSIGSRQELPNRLEELYSIEIIRLQGIITRSNRCYNDVMYKEIQRKYGNDAFNKAMK